MDLLTHTFANCNIHFFFGLQNKTYKKYNKIECTFYFLKIACFFFKIAHFFDPMRVNTLDNFNQF